MAVFAADYSILYADNRLHKQNECIRQRRHNRLTLDKNGHIYTVDYALTYYDEI